MTPSIAALQQALEATEAFDDALSQWAQAYPLTAFPEPDFKKARDALRAAGITLDSVSASNMRHVVSTLDALFAPSRAALSSLRAVVKDTGWNHVGRNGPPPCDGETVYIGINTAGFACCFNKITPDLVCSMAGAEVYTVQMSCLEWWRLLDRPAESALPPPPKENTHG